MLPCSPNWPLVCQVFMPSSLTGDDRLSSRWLSNPLSHALRLLACECSDKLVTHLLSKFFAKCQDLHLCKFVCQTTTLASTFACMLQSVSTYIRPSVTACVHQRLWIHLWHSRINYLNIHLSWLESQFFKSTPAYFWATVSPSVSTSTSVGLPARLSISTSPFISDSKVKNVLILRPPSLLASLSSSALVLTSGSVLPLT